MNAPQNSQEWHDNEAAIKARYNAIIKEIDALEAEKTALYRFSNLTPIRLTDNDGNTLSTLAYYTRTTERRIYFCCMKIGNRTEQFADRFTGIVDSNMKIHPADIQRFKGTK